MKRFALAAALALCASTSSAQAPEAPKQVIDVPKPGCQPAPEYPGRRIIQQETRRKAFERELQAYQTCMQAFIEQQRALYTAHFGAAKIAIETFNAAMTKINTDQEKAKASE